MIAADAAPTTGLHLASVTAAVDSD
jgi:hypothetical protein